MPPDPTDSNEELDQAFNPPTAELDVVSLDELKIELNRAQTLERKKEVIFGNVNEIPELNADEILENIESQETLPQDIIDYLEVGGILHAAEYRLRANDTVSTITELIEYFKSDTDSSTRTYMTVLARIMQLQTPSALTFAESYLERITDGAAEIVDIALAANAELDIISLPGAEDKGHLDKAKGLYQSHKPLFDLGIGISLAGIGIWGISRFLKREADEEKKETVNKWSGRAEKTLLAGGAVAATAIVMGKIMSNEKTDSWIANNIESFHGTRWHLAWLAFSEGRYSDSWNYMLNGEEYTPERRIQHNLLAEQLGVRAVQFERMADENFNQFMSQEDQDNNPLNRAKTQVRSQIRGNYNEYIQSNPTIFENLDQMSLGAAMQELMNQGVLRHADSFTPTLDEEGEVIDTPDDANRERTEQLEERFETPTQENLELLSQDSQELIEELNQLEQHSETYIGEIIASLSLAINTRFNNSLDDDHEYGDLKLAREELTSLKDYALMADHEAFKDMGDTIRNFQDFIVKHPNPETWTENEQNIFDSYKEDILKIRRQVNSALAYGNKEHDEAIRVDQEDGFLTVEDLSQGAGLGFQLLSGIPLYFEFFYEKAENGEYYYLTIPLFQAGMAIGANISNPPTSFGHLAFNTAKGATFDTVWKPVKFTTIEAFTRYAFKYSPKDLLLMRLRGEMSHRDVMRRIRVSEVISESLEKNSTFSQKFRQIFGSIDRPAMANFGKNYREQYFTRWLQYIDHADDTAMYAQNNYLTSLLSEGDIETIKAERVRLGLVLPKIEFRPLDGTNKSMLVINGKEVKEVLSSETSAVRDQIIEEADKRGKSIKNPSRFAGVWRAVGPIMSVVGIAFTVDMINRIDEAEGDKNQLQEVVARECASLMSFVLGTAVTYKTLSPFLKGTRAIDPKAQAIVGILAIAGGFATAMGFSEDGTSIIKHFLDKYPNGYQVTEQVGDVLTGATIAHTARAASTTVVRPASRAAMSFITKEAGSEAMEASLKQATRNLERFVGKKFAAKITAACGKEAIWLLLKRQGWKGGAGIAAVVLDGPLPIGDLLAIAFAGAAVKDIYDIVGLVTQGMKLNDELNIRKNLPLAPGGLRIKSPESLVTSTENVTDPNDLFLAAQNAENAIFEVHRVGDAGWEEWHIVNGEIEQMVIFNMAGDRIAGISDEDLDDILNAEEEVHANLDEDSE